jgi:hypothetical protein
MFRAAGIYGDDSMSKSIQADSANTAPSIVPADIPDLSDDECFERLALVIATEDARYLEEVAQLIGRLAVTIE